MPRGVGNSCACATPVAMLMLRHKRLFVLSAVTACLYVCTICLPVLLRVFGLSETLLPDSYSLCICPPI